MGANIYRSIAIGIISLCFLYIGYVLIKTKNPFLVHRYNIILIPLKYRKEFTKRAGIGICIMAAVTLIYSVLIMLFSDSFLLQIITLSFAFIGALYIVGNMVYFIMHGQQ